MGATVPASSLCVLLVAAGGKGGVGKWNREGCVGTHTPVGWGGGPIWRNYRTARSSCYHHHRHARALSLLVESNQIALLGTRRSCPPPPSSPPSSPLLFRPIEPSSQPACRALFEQPPLAVASSAPMTAAHTHTHNSINHLPGRAGRGAGPPPHQRDVCPGPSARWRRRWLAGRGLALCVGVPCLCPFFQVETHLCGWNCPGCALLRCTGGGAGSRHI